MGETGEAVEQAGRGWRVSVARAVCQKGRGERWDEVRSWAYDEREGQRGKVAMTGAERDARVPRDWLGVHGWERKG